MSSLALIAFPCIPSCLLFVLASMLFLPSDCLLLQARWLPSLFACILFPSACSCLLRLCSSCLLACHVCHLSAFSLGCWLSLHTPACSTCHLSARAFLCLLSCWLCAFKHAILCFVRNVWLVHHIYWQFHKHTPGLVVIVFWRGSSVLSGICLKLKALTLRL